ncbi:RT0821/Lpp0805 family surface protein [Limibacillus halophilus]|uniref:Surface antigen domain-containing protein n=1 Tax=Limibacillus halophilus TaxID=1579333 RepID=A0A839SYT4_9PROT|nr:RT0821/Lpp0805 family surface protein [Limibacillus halophilus]MBB3066205.1 hypothetical protein [Limibacillus halophilus]
MIGKAKQFLKPKRLMLFVGACALGFSFAAMPYSPALAGHSRQDTSGWNGSRDNDGNRRVQSRDRYEEKDYPKSRSGERRVGNGDERPRASDRNYNDRDRYRNRTDRAVVSRDDQHYQRDYDKRKKYKKYEKHDHNKHGTHGHWNQGQGHWKDDHKKYSKKHAHNHDRRRYYRDVVIYRPHGHWYSGYGYYRNDNDAYKWLAFTAITLKLLDNLNESQQRAHERAQINAATAPIGETIYWREAGAYGSVTPLRDGNSNSGRYCREFQQTVTIGGRNEQAYGTACLQPDGSWEVVSSNN